MNRHPPDAVEESEPAMRPATKIAACALFFALSGAVKAQNVGQVQCGKTDNYIYLYKSMETMEVHGKLKCAEEVQILNRYDNFLFVRTEKGDTGYVPIESVGILKGKRALTPAAATKKGTPAPRILNLFDGTPVRLKVGHTVSSADAKVGDEVPFEVTEDVVVEGFKVIRKGTKATGTVAEVAQKGRFGRSGKLTLNLTEVKLVDSETAGLRMYQETKNEKRGVSKVLPMKSGKEVTVAEGTEVFGYITGGMKLVASKFPRAKEAATSASAGDGRP